LLSLSTSAARTNSCNTCEQHKHSRIRVQKLISVA
jgi:hypothetical protein